MEKKEGYEVKGRAFVSYLDEYGKPREGIVDILRFDASFIQFKNTSGKIIFIPSARILKVKELEGKF